MLVTTYGYDLDSIEMKNFLVDYKNKYGREVSEEIYGALGYDVYNILYESFEICGDNPECIKDYLNEVKERTGAGGKYILDEKGDAIRDVVVRKVVNGKLELV